MSLDPSLLTTPIAGWTVAEGLAAAVEAGVLREIDTTHWQMPAPPAETAVAIAEHRDADRHCRFKMQVIFKQIYREKFVPLGCATCFKVKVTPRSLRELMALRAVAHALPYTYKCGLEAQTAYTSSIYSAYFYLNSLQEAREAYFHIRTALDNNPLLGPDIPAFIKRGCTTYEMACGPSNQYTFDQASETIEQALQEAITETKTARSPADKIKTFALWIETAYRFGDASYLDFTNGKPLHPAPVKYEP